MGIFQTDKMVIATTTMTTLTFFQSFVRTYKFFISPFNTVKGSLTFLISSYCILFTPWFNVLLGCRFALCWPILSMIFCLLLIALISFCCSGLYHLKHRSVPPQTVFPHYQLKSTSILWMIHCLSYILS